MIQYYNDQLTNKCGFFRSVYDSAIGVATEVGELLDLVRMCEGGKKCKEGTDLTNLKEKISDEIADVLVYLLQVATHYGIDVEVAFMNKYEKIMKRKFING